MDEQKITDAVGLRIMADSDHSLESYNAAVSAENALSIEEWAEFDRRLSERMDASS